MKNCPTCTGVVSPSFNVVDFKPWEVHEFPWGCAVKKKNGKWTNVIIGEQEVNVENKEVILHENGIEFVYKE